MIKRPKGTIVPRSEIAPKQKLPKLDFSNVPKAEIIDRDSMFSKIKAFISGNGFIVSTQAEVILNRKRTVSLEFLHNWVKSGLLKQEWKNVKIGNACFKTWVFTLNE